MLLSKELFKGDLFNPKVINLMTTTVTVCDRTRLRWKIIEGGLILIGFKFPTKPQESGLGSSVIRKELQVRS